MSFNESYTLKNAANADVVFTKLNGDAQKSNFMDIASNLSTPRLVMISHQMSSSPVGVDRHLVKISVTERDAAGKSMTGVVNVTLNIPRGMVLAPINDLVALGKSFLTTEVVDKLSRGEV